ncbi:MAG: hypothetical protein O3A68_03425 [Proteobacteria bacterium]|nr:hypothetical protein [Pseudomonadota bacterium]
MRTLEHRADIDRALANNALVPESKRLLRQLFHVRDSQSLAVEH